MSLVEKGNKDAIERRDKLERERPELWACNRLPWRVFWHASRGRLNGMAMGVIPPSEISSYINNFLSELNLDEDEREDLLLLVEKMDDFYYSFQNKKSEKKPNNVIVDPTTGRAVVR